MKNFARIMAFFLAMTMIVPMAAKLPAAQAAEADFRAVWVSTIFHLDYPNSATTDASVLKDQADQIIKNCKEMGMNTIILQVRPSSDSLYPSTIYPWSKYLTGAQGQAPSDNFDPLEYWVTKAHESGLKLHAWINPFRVASTEAEFNTLTATHPAKEHPDWVVQHTDGKYYFNPGIPDVRKLVVSGVEEIIANYMVDGIHLDDYFYPDATFADSATYAQYGTGYTGLDEWRRNNIDELISELRQTILRSGGSIQFGVSPAGIWANQSSKPEGSATNGNQTYFSHFADTRKWVQQGWLDYICPQIYWHIGNSAADYNTLVNWWADTVRGTGVALYIGMADYQAGNSDPASPWYGTAEIERQIALNRAVPEVTGEVHFRYQFLVENTALKEYYTRIYNGGETQETPPDDTAIPPDPSLPTHQAYMEGSNGKFKPEGRLTRAEAAMLFARLKTNPAGESLFDPNTNYTSTFVDIKQGEWYASAVGFTEQYKILAGYSDKTYRPNQTITRAEFAALVARFENADAKATTDRFADVPETHWANPYIASAVEKGYIAGYGDGSFQPESPITRAETVKIINKMLGRTPDTAYIDQHPSINVFTDLNSSHWAYYEVMEASHTHYYEQANGGESWQDSSSANDIPFISDTFDFVFPDLITTAPLEPLDLTKVDSIALHHMAHPTADFKTVEKWHLDQGWRAFGYNFWIDFEGNVYVGRGWNLGAGVANQNGHILSIGFQGDYEEVNKAMPDAQYKAGVELIKWISARVPSVKQVAGHGDFNATLCPGKYFPMDAMCKDSGF